MSHPKNGNAREEEECREPRGIKDTVEGSRLLRVNQKAEKQGAEES